MSDLRLTLLGLIERHGAINCTEISEQTGYTRQTVHRYLRSMVDAGELAVSGRARATRYFLPKFPPGLLQINLGEFDTDEIWATAEPKLLPSSASPAARGLARFCFGELLSNASTHSAGASATLHCQSLPDLIRFELADTGLGLFTRVREKLKLASDLDALVELSKSPLTTMPATHFGRGLFVVAAACQRFHIVANGLRWTQDNIRGDQLLSQIERVPGTRVGCEIDPASEAEAQQLLRERAASSSPLSATGRVALLVLNQQGTGNFVSRAEAQSLMRGMEQLREVRLDFTGVEGVGSGFAEEIFAVWAAAHPKVRIRVLNANPVVQRVIDHAASAMTES